MIASWYVALKHELPKYLPPDVAEHRDRLLFARWLVMTGRLSDFGPYPGGRTGDESYGRPISAEKISRLPARSADVR